MPVSRTSSKTSRSLTSFPFILYSLSPERYSFRETVISENSLFILPSALSNTKVTSAKDFLARCAVPPNMTSSILSPRRFLLLCSPRTHLSASAMLLFPLPFGPTIPVMPGVISKCVLFANDLKPFNSIVFKYNYFSRLSVNAIRFFNRVSILPHFTSARKYAVLL